MAYDSSMSTQHNDWGHEDFRSDRKNPSLGSFAGLGQPDEGRIEFPDQPAAKAEESDREDEDCIVQSNASNPTAETTRELVFAYDYFNAILFSGQLPACLITLQRKAGALGYFCAERFINGERRVTDEIALNPAYFAEQTTDDILSTLVHEQVHLWQQHFGEPGRGRYHNRQWAAKMESLGLMPSSTGRPGGRKTGDHMSDYIITDGAFDRAAAALIEAGFRITWQDRRLPQAALPPDDGSTPPGGQEAPDNRSNREKYHCPGCGLNAWAKPGARLICGTCLRPMNGAAGQRNPLTFN